MALWQGHLTHNERDEAKGQGPRAAYWMLDPAGSGRLVRGVGAKDGEAVAFLKFEPLASAPGRFTLDDDPAEEDRRSFLIGETRVIS